MAAPPENQFWKQRSKHGRDMIFSTPEILWASACEYFEWCDANPWQQQNWVGKDGDEVVRKLTRPYTLSGLCVFMECGEQTFRDYRVKEDFSEVITRIEQIIRTQKFEGAAVGLFNANIIARDLGLTEKSEHTGKDGGPIEHDHKFKITLNLNK